MEFKAIRKPKTIALKSIAIVDSDPHFQSTAESYCHDMGIKNISFFNLCEDAWSYIKEGSFDLIVLDWRCKGQLSPIGLFNRIKNHGASLLTPILIVSGYTERHDFRLLQEFPLVSLVEKPFTAGVFFQTVEQLKTERKWYLKNTSKLAKMVEKLSSQKKICKHIDFVVNQSPNPAPLAAVLGKILRQKKNYDAAEEVLRTALAKNAQHVALLNEIGKLYHVLGRHKEALRYLKRAESLSPENTQRLCLMGELALGESLTEEASQSFNHALKIDPWYLRPKEGIHLCQELDSFQQSQANSHSTNLNFASLMNTVGISKVRSGKLEEGMKHYDSALKFIYDPTTKSKIMFNMGLGFLRFKNIQSALLWFMRSSKESNGSYTKANHYVEKLSDMFVLTSDGPSSTHDHTKGVSVKKDSKEADCDDDLYFDDFDDDIMDHSDGDEFADEDEFDDESILGA